MKRKIYLLLCLGMAPLWLLSQTAPLSPRVANYQMDIELDVTSKKLYGSTTLLWRNPSQDTVRELQFHLYYNAFKNTRSTFVRESIQLSEFFKSGWDGECGWSWSEIQRIKDEQGNDLSKGMSFIQPDDNNKDDQTVLRVPLTIPALPGGEIQIQFDWEAKIPKTMVRTGYNKDFYFFAQWFPKVGVYEAAGVRYATKGQWNCHQYHAAGEYYSDFGVYDVSLTVPKDYIVGASGALQQKEQKGEQTTWRFYVEDVIDFTWTTSPEFLVLTDQWKDVQLSLLCYPGHEQFADRYFGTVKNALEFMDEKLGAYPYPTLTMVDPPIHGLFTGGMEYPTLFTSISLCFIPEGIKTTETLIVHEFVHQYFMQMVATHEKEEPWMDEGMTTYYEGRILDKYDGEYTSLVDWMGMKMGNSIYNRWEYLAMDNPKIADNSYESWEFRHGGYSRISYNKVGVWLKTLEGLIGQEVFDEVMRTFFERWKFRHPCKRDFTSIVDEVVRKRHGDRFGPNMQWFFDQVLEGSDQCDYAIASITNDEIRPDEGFLTGTNECILDPEPLAAAERGYRSKVILHRLGEVKLPIEVEIVFDDGRRVVELWDGESRSVDFSYVGKSRIETARIDPERKIWLDANWINNSQTFEPQTKSIHQYLSKFLAGLQNMMESLNAFI